MWKDQIIRRAAFCNWSNETWLNPPTGRRVFVALWENLGVRTCFGHGFNTSCRVNKNKDWKGVEWNKTKFFCVFILQSTFMSNVCERPRLPRNSWTARQYSSYTAVCPCPVSPQLALVCVPVCGCYTYCITNSNLITETESLSSLLT